MRSRRITAAAVALVAGLGAMGVGAGSAHATVAYGTAGHGPCTTHLSTTNAAANVQAIDTYTHGKTWMTVSESSNQADYWACNAAGTPVRITSMSGVNNYSFTGVKFDGCSVGWPLGFNCSWSGVASTLTDTSATACGNCYSLIFDEIGINVTWRSGVLTHYHHTASVLFTGKTTAGTASVRVNSNVDTSIV